MKPAEGDQTVHQTVHQTLDQIREIATSEHEKGKLFEGLMCTFFQTDPLYEQRFEKVWAWEDNPLWDGPDTGIDLVGKERGKEEYCAIQCKFYGSAVSLRMKDLGSFMMKSEALDQVTSRIIVTTTDKRSPNLKDLLRSPRIPLSILGLRELEEREVVWPKIERRGDERQIKPRLANQLRAHQQEALEATLEGFREHESGRVIMACGTGKTLLSLRIAEKMVNFGGTVIYLVPSIALISQALSEWSKDREIDHRYLIICSDETSGHNDVGYKTADLLLPATTDPRKIYDQLKTQRPLDRMMVVFSTYQSLEVLIEVQRMGVSAFDLIICDEAHRTVGAEKPNKEASSFQRVHDRQELRAKKRLFMTATPRIFSEAIKEKARVPIYSMDDEDRYGPEFYTLNFSKAVSAGLLSDYKVIVLHISQDYIAKILASEHLRGLLQEISSTGNWLQKINTSNTGKMIGCWKGLMSPGIIHEGDVPKIEPLKKAIAFTNTIRDSQIIKEVWPKIIESAVDLAVRSESGRAIHDDLTRRTCTLKHVDGTMPAHRRKQDLKWLNQPNEDECRILTNARCLSEGVDVPALDAILFMAPRRSTIDIVQSVGRVMRVAQGKDYGYIILPVVVNQGQEPEKVLESSDYQVVWDVLRAMRSHDNRLDHLINAIDLNQTKASERIQLLAIDDDGNLSNLQYEFPFGDNFNPNLIYAKTLEKVGDRQYWDLWAKDVAKIASYNTTRIQELIKKPELQSTFQTFLENLQNTINSSLGEKEAIQILSQHIIAKPVFEALFENYRFGQENPVSKTMETMLTALREYGLESETKEIRPFYESVRARAEGIETPAGRQTLIKELYGKFFQIALEEEAKRLGIVYTPDQIIDFILHSVSDLLEEEFGSALTNQHVHIIDPFTGTGSFLVRLLQESTLIADQDLSRKFHSELHANEIVLLAYYMAAVSIEEAYHSRRPDHPYKPFEGIVYCDTFTTQEHKGSLGLFLENTERLRKQNERPITVILGNPPWSAYNEDLTYPTIDTRIGQTYTQHSRVHNKVSLYDHYIRAFRWASDRIEKDGIIAFVTNGGFVNSNAGGGMRECLSKEFQTIYCFNLRGNAYTQGDIRQKEGGNIFGSGSRASVAIVVLIKNAKKSAPCRIFYKDIGDYLSREEKLDQISSWRSIMGVVDWQEISIDEHQDWLNHRDPTAYRYLPLGSHETKQRQSNEAIFRLFSGGIKTHRDAWMYNSSRNSLRQTIQKMIGAYHQPMDHKNRAIKWDQLLKKHRLNKRRVVCSDSLIRPVLYRPFFKQWLYFEKIFINSTYRMPEIFPTYDTENLAIYVTGTGTQRPFSVLIINLLPDLHYISAGQCFPHYIYPKKALLVESERVDNILDETLEKYQSHYRDLEITKEDIFYYIYGVLHSQEYRVRFKNNLFRDLPRIPMAREFKHFVQAGRKLADLHLHYESLEGYPLTQESVLDFDESNPDHTRVQKLTVKRNDRSRIIVNHYMILAGVPDKAWSSSTEYRYSVNGRTPLEWVIDSYQVSVDKESGIENDPNQWSSDDPMYIIRLIKQVIQVGLESMEIIETLPSPFDGA